MLGMCHVVNTLWVWQWIQINKQCSHVWIKSSQLYFNIAFSFYSHVQYGMFQQASVFNQDIGNWDVSSGEYFVRIVMNTYTAMYRSNHVTPHNVILPFLVILICRVACFLKHCHLIKTLAIGMFPMVKTLWV